MKKQFRGEFYKGAGNEYRWRIRAISNGNIVADSAEGYKNSSECMRMFKALHPTLKVIFLTH